MHCGRGCKPTKTECPDGAPKVCGILCRTPAWSYQGTARYPASDEEDPTRRQLSFRIRELRVGGSLPRMFHGTQAFRVQLPKYAGNRSQVPYLHDDMRSQSHYRRGIQDPVTLGIWTLYGTYWGTGEVSGLRMHTLVWCVYPVLLISAMSSASIWLEKHSRSNSRP